MELIEKDSLQNLFKGPLNKSLIFNVAYRASGFSKINKFYSKHLLDKTGLSFIDGSFESLNIRYVCPENDLKHIPKEGPFIVISNHPFGFLDGLIMIRVFGERFENFKTLSTFVLTLFKPLQNFFIEVDPFGTNPSQNFKGIREALEHIKAGNPIGIFPSGEVSTYYGRKTYVEDKEWSLGSIKLIEKAGVPVIPMFFHGQNSRAFHLKGRINPFLRTISLPSEFFKKKDEEVFFRIGSPLKAIDYKKETTEETRACLRSQVNALKLSTKVDRNVLRLNLKFRIKKPEKVIAPIPKVLLEQDILNLPETQKLLSKSEFDVFFAFKHQIPNVLSEIGRLREITFREVGEGTNKPIDLDAFDDYYAQLFVWNNSEKEILGGYRLGCGDYIMEHLGKKGFYVNSLFEMDDELIPMLAKTIEMGRSFVVSKYQRKPHSLFLLWNGVIKFVLRNEKHNFLMGPVSISNDFSQFSKELIMSFIRKYYYNYELAQHIHPKKAFKVNGFREKDVESILDYHKNDLKKLDNYISELEIRGMRIPVLIKKYLNQNAKVVGFNVDPDFNFSLDGLMILNIEDLPKESLNMFNV